jgi:FkbM family methyltransferase
MKVIKKIKEKYKQFLTQPVTKDNEIKAIYRYVLFNVKNKMTRQITFNWIEGLKFIARKGDAGIVGNIYFGLYEFEESIFLLHLIEKEDVFIDIGANVGHYSLLMSGIKKCKSIAVEPVPETFKQLVKQVELNNLGELITLLNIGVSDSDGELFFSTDKGTMNRIVNKNYENLVKVKVSTIDALSENNIPIAIKIDVEGYEKHALMGAQKTLSNHVLKVIIVELNESGVKHGIKDDEIYSEIVKFGFKPFSYDAINRKLIPLLSYNKHKFNTLFIRDIEYVKERVSGSKKIRIKNKLF